LHISVVPILLDISISVKAKSPGGAAADSDLAIEGDIEVVPPAVGIGRFAGAGLVKDVIDHIRQIGIIADRPAAMPR
jgi:hypothetical protein